MAKEIDSGVSLTRIRLRLDRQTEATANHVRRSNVGLAIVEALQTIRLRVTLRLVAGQLVGLAAVGEGLADVLVAQPEVLQIPAKVSELGVDHLASSTASGDLDLHCGGLGREAAGAGAKDHAVAVLDVLHGEVELGTNRLEGLLVELVNHHANILANSSQR